jgi:hypothetical protein
MNSEIKLDHRVNSGIFVPGDTSICEYLCYLDISSIVKYVEEHHYSDKVWHYRYDPELMIKLAIIKCFRRRSYEKTILSLTAEECIILEVPEVEDKFKLPSPKTLHHFVKYRIGEEGFENIMRIVGKMIVEMVKSSNGIVDSTPIEASRYDKHADFNPHYRIKMYKAHIFHYERYPLYFIFTEGNANDSPLLLPLIEEVKEMGMQVDSLLLDGGYDSFKNHADIWYHLSAHPYIDLRFGSVLHEEANMDRIDHWVNKLWKEGGSIHMEFDEKLRFLYEHGREEQVGMYLRDVNLCNPYFNETYRKRGGCERTHEHIKDIVKFDVRRVPDKSKYLYTLVNFVSYQLLILTNLQNGIKPANQFGRYR